MTLDYSLLYTLTPRFSQKDKPTGPGMQRCQNVNRRLRGHYNTDLWWMVFFRSQDDVTKLVCHIYDIMLRLVDKPGLFVLRNCLTESMSGIHSVISSRCLYLITPLLYMFFLLHMFGCFGSCGTYILEVCVLLFVLSCFKFYPYGWEVNMSSLLYTLIIYPCFSLCKAR